MIWTYKARRIENTAHILANAIQNQNVTTIITYTLEANELIKRPFVPQQPLWRAFVRRIYALLEDSASVNEHAIDLALEQNV
jgi:hypothetical protein